ncbi:MAG: hypothetical protein AAB229_10465 [Candidatus Hydrogenedentota bacterium]
MRGSIVVAAGAAVLGYTVVVAGMAGCGSKTPQAGTLDGAPVTTASADLTAGTRERNPEPFPGKPAVDVLAWDNLFTSVDGFYDADDDASFNARILSNPAGKGSLTAVGEADWGKSVLVVPQIDFSRGPVLTVVVSDVEEGASWNVGATSNPWSDAAYHTIIPSQNRAGTVTADLAQTTGWTSPRDNFNLVLVIEGRDKSVIFDSLHINYTK